MSAFVLFFPILSEQSYFYLKIRWALRNNGAFFIKRRIDPVTGRKDILYRAILCAYMTECLKAGYHLEFFIEGGRTRTGKPVIPKGNNRLFLCSKCKSSGHMKYLKGEMDFH